MTSDAAATRRAPRNQRGIALLSVLALLIVFLIFAGAVMTQLAQEVNSSKTNAVSVRALSAADAGIHGMMLTIEENNGAAQGFTYTYRYPEPGASPSTTQYTVSVDNTYGALPTGGYRFYVITSEGQFDNGIQHQKRKVRAVVRAVSLAEYSSFSVYETNQNGKTVWYTPDQFFNGLVYSGGPMHVEYDNTHWDYSQFKPVFGATVRTVNNPVFLELQGGLPVDDSNDWSAVINGGSDNFDRGVKAVALPGNNTNVLVGSEAYYGNCCSITTSYPAVSPGVYMNQVDAAAGSGPLTTGIYIQGDAKMTSTATPSTEQFVISSKSFAPYTITINLPNGPTTVTQGSSTATYSGVPSGTGGPGQGNGAIFDNGNLTIASGSVTHGQYMIAVPDYLADNITLLGSLTYFDTTKDLLGLWADNVILNTPASNVVIDAAIIAGFPGEKPNDGGLYNQACNNGSCGASDQGTLTVFGSLAENMRGAVGKFFPGPPPRHVGFDRHLNYDSRLATNPPPFDPTTGQFDIIAWEDLGQ